MARYNAYLNSRVKLQWWLLITALATIGLSATDLYYGPLFNTTVRRMSAAHLPWNPPPGMENDQYLNWTKTLHFPPNIDDLVPKRSGLTLTVGDPNEGTEQMIKLIPWWANILTITAPSLSVIFVIGEWCFAYYIWKAKNAGSTASDAINEAELKLDKCRASMDISALINWMFAVPYFAAWHGWYGTFVCKGNTCAFCDWGRGAFSVACVGLFLAACTTYTSIKLGKLKGLSMRDMLCNRYGWGGRCSSASNRPQPAGTTPVQRPGPVTGMNGRDDSPPPVYDKEMEAGADSQEVRWDTK